MKQMIVVVGVLLCVGLFAGEKISDPIVKKYKGRLTQLKRRYQKDVNKIESLMIRDYNLLLKQKTRAGDLKGALVIQKKIEDLTPSLDFVGVPQSPDNYFKKGKITNIIKTAEITVSSKYSENNLAKNVSDGNLQTEWITKHETVGAWIEFKWKQTKEVSKVILYDRHHPKEKIINAVIIFSDGSKINTKELTKNKKGKKIKLKHPKYINSMRIEITKAIGNNSGLGEVEIFGR